MSAFKRLENHTLYINFDEYVDYRITLEKDGRTAYSLASVLGPRRRFSSPERLQETVDQYFESCLGPTYTRSGLPILDLVTKEPVIRVVKPYTVSGLARYLGVTTKALMDFKYSAIMNGIPDEYLPILSEARQRIEEYSETRLYDTDGTKGAQFALSASFGWETPRDRHDRVTGRERVKMQKDEHKMKMNLLENGEGDGSGINIVITRAGRRDELAEGDTPISENNPAPDDPTHHNTINVDTSGLEV